MQLVYNGILSLLCFTLCFSSACSSVQSSVQELVANEPRDETYAGRQHFPVTPQEAVDFLAEIAPRHGWEVVSTGDEYDGRSQRGKFFRLEPNRAGGGRKAMSGVFYAEPKGTYVRVSEDNGLPELLVAPLIAEIKEKNGYR
jgi:hypothetical protein